MKKIVIVYGLISGAIITCFLWIWIYLWEKGILTFDNGEIYFLASNRIATIKTTGRSDFGRVSRSDY